MNTDYVIQLIFDELRAAEKKHPGWPEDKIHAVGIIIEEAGESMQAAIDLVYNNGDIDHLKKELAQTGAMCIRALIDLEITTYKDNKADTGAGQRDRAHAPG